MRVFAVSFNASLGFKPSCECVAHTGYQQPRRTVRNDLRIDEHQIRILCVNPVTQKSTTLGVDYRQSTARSVARGHGRAVDHRQIEIGCNGARGVEHLTDARAHDYSYARVAGMPLHTLDLGQGTLAPERKTQ